MIASPFNPIVQRPTHESDGIESRYMQTFSTLDPIFVEYICGANEAVQLRLYNHTENTYREIATTPYLINPGTAVRYATLSGLSVGEVYSLQTPDGTYKTFHFRVTDNADELKDTVLVQYSNNNNRQRTDAVFVMFDDDEFERKFFSVRIPGGFKDSETQFGIDNEQFTTQTGDLCTIYAKDSVQRKFTLGHNLGVPSYLGALLNLIHTCTYVYYDGERYERVEGSTPEQSATVDGLDSFIYKLLLQRCTKMYPTLADGIAAQPDPEIGQGSESGGGGGGGGGGGSAEHADYADEAGHAMTADVATNAGYAARAGEADVANDLSDELKQQFNNKYIRKDIDDHTTHTLGVGNLNVGYDEQGRPIGGVNGDLKVKGTANTNKIVNSGDINNTNGTITTKNLEVTGSAHFFELVIDKIKAAGGSSILSVADGFKVDYVEVNGEYTYLCFLAERDGKQVRNMWQAGDFAICMSMNAAEGTSYEVSNKYWWAMISGASTDAASLKVIGDMSYHWISVRHTKFGTDPSKYDGVFAIEVGDEVSQLGSTDATRGNAIYQAAYMSIDKGNSSVPIDGLVAPLIAEYKGINEVGMNSLYKFRRTYFAANGNKMTGSFAIETASEDIPIKQEIIGDRVYAYMATTSFDAPSPSSSEWAAQAGATQAKPYLWRRTHRFFSDGTDDYIVEFQTQWNGGEKGADGFTYYTGAQQWANGDSGTQAPASGWVDSQPAPVMGKYLWYRYKTYRRQGSVEDTAYNNAAPWKYEIIGYIGKDGINGDDGYTYKIDDSTIQYGNGASDTTYGDITTWAASLAVVQGKYRWKRYKMQRSNNLITWETIDTYIYELIGYTSKDGQDGQDGDNVARMVANPAFLENLTTTEQKHIVAKDETPALFVLSEEKTITVNGFVGEEGASIDSVKDVYVNGLLITPIQTTQRCGYYTLTGGVLTIILRRIPNGTKYSYVVGEQEKDIYAPVASGNIVVDAVVNTVECSLSIPFVVDFSLRWSLFEVTDERFTSQFDAVDSHFDNVDGMLSTHTSMIAQNAQEIELRATKTELSTAETKLTQTANYINISAQQYANNTRNMIANGLVNWVGNYSAGSVSFAYVALQANRVYVLSAKGFVNASTNGGAVTVQLGSNYSVQFTPYDSAMQTKHLLIKPTSAASLQPKIVPTTSWTTAGEYGYISFVQLVDVTNEYNSKPSTMTDAEFVYQSVTGYSLNELDKTTNPNLIEGNSWVTGYAPSKAASVPDQRGKKGSVLQLGTNNLLYLGNWMNKGKTYAVSFYAQRITASPAVKIAVQKGAYTIISPSYTRAMGQSCNGQSFGSGTTPVSVAVEGGWAKYTFVVTPTDSNLTSYLLINVDGGAAYINDLRVEEWGRATEYSSVNITADQVYIQSGSKDLGNVFSVDGNTGDVVMRDLTARNVTVEGVINNLVTVIDCNTDDRVHQNSAEDDRWELDLLRCPSVFKLINLPPAGASSAPGISIPWYISGQSASSPTAQCHTQTKYGTGQWHDMTTMEFYQLLGRDFTIIVGDSANVTQLNYGCAMTTLIDRSSSVLNALQGLCYFRSFTDNNAYILTPSTVVHIKLFQACYFPTGGTPFAAFIWQVNALSYSEVAGLVDDFWD